MLEQLPRGTSVFIDANIFLYKALNHWEHGEACKTFIEAIAAGDYRGITSVMVCNEVFHTVHFERGGLSMKRELNDYIEDIIGGMLLQLWCTVITCGTRSRRGN